MTLRVVIDNEAPPKALECKYSPYLIDVDARGVVVVPKGAERRAPAEDLAAVNGASLLWSAVREQVLALTSRMQAGPVTLPTMNFHDLTQREQSSQPHASVTKAKAMGRRGKKRSVA